MGEEFKVDIFNRGYKMFDMTEYILESKFEQVPAQHTMELFHGQLYEAIANYINPEIIKYYKVTEVLLQSDGKFRIKLSKRLFIEDN